MKKLGCNVGCPFIGKSFDDNWGIEDPTGKSDEDFKTVMKEIGNKVLELKGIISSQLSQRRPSL